MHYKELELLARQLADGCAVTMTPSAANWSGSLPAGIQSRESTWRLYSR